MSKGGKKRAPYNAGQVKKRFEDALLFLCNQEKNPPPAPYKKVSISQVARDHDISHLYDTLRRRFKGETREPSKAHENQQNLSHIQEEILVEWLGHLSNESQPLSKRQLRRSIILFTGGALRPGRNWMARFLKRNPSIRLGKPSNLDPKRGKAFNKITVTDYFSLLKQILDKYQIPWENVWNMDEKGCQRGGGRKTSAEKFFIPRHRRPHYRRRSANLELVTIIECINAVGDSIKPGFVFSGTRVHRGWYEVDPQITISTSPNGWTDNFLCTEWFKKSFIEQACARNTSVDEDGNRKPILLIFDGHGSHLTEEMHKLALQHNIHLLCLPAHTTHRLQPLDVGVFGPLATAYARRCDEVLDETGAEIPIQDFVAEYMAAREEAFTPTTIRKAFEKAGICPLNPNVFTNADFAPSNPSSIRAHVPDSFPAVELPDEVMQHILAEPEEEEEGDEERDLDLSSDEENDKDENHDEDDNNMSSDTTRLSRDTVSRDGQSMETHPQESSTTPGTPAVTPTNSPNVPTSAEAVQMPAISNCHHNERSATQPTHQPQTLEDALRRIQELENSNKELTIRVEKAEMHCAIVKTCYEGEKKKVNAKSTRKDTATVTLSAEARCLTSGEGLIQFEAQLAADKEKKRKREEAHERREAAKVARIEEHQRKGPAEFFTGSLQSKGKLDLQDIAKALKISLVHPAPPGPKPAGFKAKELTKSQLITVIKAQLTDNEAQLKENPRFASLYGTSRSQATTTADKENVPPASSAVATRSKAVSIPLSSPQPAAGPSHHTFQIPASPYPHHLHIPSSSIPGPYQHPVPYHAYPYPNIPQTPYNHHYHHPNLNYPL